MRRSPLLTLIAILAAAASGAQELTLDAAVDTALQNNPEVAAARERAAAAAGSLPPSPAPPAAMRGGQMGVAAATAT